MKYDLIITDIFNKLGICKYYLGIDFTSYAMELIDSDKQYLNYVTKYLYVDIAKESNTTPTSVEKNLRTVINRIWKNPDICKDVIFEIFGEKFLHTKPSNKEFIQMIYEYTKRKEKMLTEDKICPYYNVKCCMVIQH